MITISSVPAGWSISRPRHPPIHPETTTQTEVNTMNLIHSSLAALAVLTLGFSAPLLAQQPAATSAACDTACDAGKCDSNAGSCDSAGPEDDAV